MPYQNKELITGITLPHTPPPIYWFLALAVFPLNQDNFGI